MTVSYKNLPLSFLWFVSVGGVVPREESAKIRGSMGMNLDNDEDDDDDDDDDDNVSHLSPVDGAQLIDCIWMYAHEHTYLQCTDVCVCVCVHACVRV